MKRTVSAFGILLLLVLIVPYAASGYYDQPQEIPQGTVISAQNWEQYKQYMPEGMQLLFSGQSPWKFPSSLQITIGPQHHYEPSKVYEEDTEKYAQNVRIVDRPDGSHSITGYVAGCPFPKPSGPLAGYKILIDEWFRYIPWITCTSPNGVQAFAEDRFGNTAFESDVEVFRHLDFISDADMPKTDPDSRGVYLSEWFSSLLPEQSRYTTDLTLYYDDFTKDEDEFLFIPGMRRSLRLSSAARCAPLLGSDWLQDDLRLGYNGGVVRFDAKLVREQKIITLTYADTKAVADLNNYYLGIYWPKPALQFEVRPVYVVDVERVPSQRAGYCYSKRRMYIDKDSYIAYWTDLYDMSGKFWKAYYAFHIARPVPNEGLQAETGEYITGIYDMQNVHLSWGVNVDKQGDPIHDNKECQNYNGSHFTDVNRYSSPSGLNDIMR